MGFVSLEENITLNIVEAWAIHLDSLGGSYIVGSNGGVRLNPFCLYRSMGDLDINATADLEAFEYRLHAVRKHGNAYDGPLQHWIAALQGRVPLIPTSELALNTMLISEGIYLSDHLGREVTAEEVINNSKSNFIDL